LSSPERAQSTPAAGGLPRRGSAVNRWQKGLPAGRALRASLTWLRVGHLAVLPVLGLSAVLEVNRLSRNGWANNYYSAAVKSMLRSWHNFVFASFDPGGLMMIDKPPVGVWIQTASAKLFGFTQLSVLLPEAIAAVLACAALYWIVARRWGVWAGVASALALAVFPSFVAITRDNDPDAFLILFMILACGAALRAVETGRMRWLFGCAVLVGLAFNTKTLAAYLVLPGIVLAYLTCAPGTALRRFGQLVGAGVVLAVVSFAWLAFVDLTPAHQRPYVGSTRDNSELSLAFNYNGFGRVGGQVGGPGRIPNVTTGANLRGRGKPGLASAPPGTGAGGIAATPGTTSSGSAPSSIPTHGRLHHPIAFSGSTGPLRLFDGALGDQGGWLLPFAFVGLIAIAISVPRRRDAQWGTLLVLGGWFVVEAVVLSSSQGIVHPYYVSALGPGAAAMVGAGSVALARLARRGRPALILTGLAVAGTVIVQLVLLDREHYLEWFEPFLIAGAAVGVLAMLALRSRWRSPPMALVLGVLLVAPTAYASTVWSEPVEGTFPAAGPHQANGPGGVGIKADNLPNYVNLAGYLRTHRPTAPWTVLTDATSPASPLILIGIDAAAMGGYSGTDPVLDGPGLAALIQRGEARYVLLGGAYASRGGNQATTAVAVDCRQVPQAEWRGLLPAAPAPKRNGLLYAGPWLPPPRGGVVGGGAGRLLRDRFGRGTFTAPGPAPAGRGLAPVGRRLQGLSATGLARVRPLQRLQPPRRLQPALPLQPFSFALYDCAGRAPLLATTRP
jgi:4-amino-4-deoxy-L-arabinose transferase-like glycosyltransferase